MGLLKGQTRNKAFDFSGKFLSLGGPKTVLSAGKQLTVSEAEFLDSDGSNIAVSVWKQARTALDSLQPGTGVAVIGSNATVQGGDVKVNVGPVRTSPPVAPRLSL